MCKCGIVQQEVLLLNYSFKQVTDDDVLDVLTIYISNDAYFETMSESAPSEDIVEHDRNAIAVGVDDDAKYYEIVYHEQQPIAILDFLVGYPNAQTIYIGLLMIDASLHGQQHGERILADFCERWRHAPITTLRLGVAAQHERAYTFWQRLGFDTVDEKEAAVGGVTHSFIIMERAL